MRTARARSCCTAADMAWPTRFATNSSGSPAAATPASCSCPRIWLNWARTKMANRCQTARRWPITSGAWPCRQLMVAGPSCARAVRWPIFNFCIPTVRTIRAAADFMRCSKMRRAFGCRPTTRPGCQNSTRPSIPSGPRAFSRPCAIWSPAAASLGGWGAECRACRKPSSPAMRRKMNQSTMIQPTTIRPATSRRTAPGRVRSWALDWHCSTEPSWIRTSTPTQDGWSD